MRDPVLFVWVSGQAALLSDHEEQLGQVTWILGPPIVPLLAVCGSHGVEQHLVSCAILKKDGTALGEGEFGHNGNTCFGQVRQARAVGFELEQGPVDELLFGVRMLSA